MVLLLFILIIVIIFSIDVFNKVSKPYKGYNKEIRIHVAKGSPVKKIASFLFQNKVISNKTYFVLYYRLFFHKLSFQSGEYLFNTPLTMKQIIEKLNKGKVILYKITVKEGLIIKEVAEFLQNNHKIDAQQFIKACQQTHLINRLDKKAEYDLASDVDKIIEELSQRAGLGQEEIVSLADYFDDEGETKLADKFDALLK